MDRLQMGDELLHLFLGMHFKDLTKVILSIMGRIKAGKKNLEDMFEFIIRR